MFCGKRQICFWLAIISFAFILAGCGGKTENTSYYYGPSWTRAANIALVYGLQSVNKDFIGSQIGSSYTENIVTMDATGANQKAWFNVTDTSAYQITCSPTTDYLAYMTTLSSGYYSKVVIRSISGTASSGVIDLIELSFNPGIKSFDWSSDARKIVYCTATEVRTVNIDGTSDTLVTAESGVTFVSWKYGNRIAFVTQLAGGKQFSLIYPDGSGLMTVFNLSTVDIPQISPVNTNEVFGISGQNYYRIEIGFPYPPTIIKTNFTGSLPRISPDATKVVYSKTGERSGVYSLDLTTGLETQIK